MGAASGLVEGFDFPFKGREGRRMAGGDSFPHDEGMDFMALGRVSGKGAPASQYLIIRVGGNGKYSHVHPKNSWIMGDVSGVIAAFQ